MAGMIYKEWLLCKIDASTTFLGRLSVGAQCKKVFFNKST